MTGPSRKYQKKKIFRNRPGEGIARLLVVILCLGLFCAFLPVTAMAAEEEEENIIPETEDIAQEEIAPVEGSAVIIENVVTVDGEQVNDLGALLEGDEEEDDLSYVNDFPVVVQTQVFDNTGVMNQTLESPYVNDPETGGPATTPTTPVEGLYQVKPDAQPISNSIVIEGSTEDITPPEDVQEELAKEEFGGLQKLDNNTPNDTTDDTYVRTRKTESENAINKAIEDALARATSDSESITIVVAAGEYNGDIIVDAAGQTAEHLMDGFKLYVMTEDAYEAPEDGEIIDKSTISSDGEGVAAVNGNIQINASKQFELIMAGLYFSVDSLVKAQGKASVTIHGTQEDDTVTYTQSGSGDTSISTGDGDDAVAATIGGSGDLLVEGGDGADEVSVELATDEEIEVTVEGEDGDDTVNISAAEGSGQKASVTVNTGAGSDRMYVDLNTANAVSTLNVDGGEDYDVLTLAGEINADHANSVTETAIYENAVVVDYNFVINAASKAGKLITINANKVNALADGITNKPTQIIEEDQVQEDGTISVSGSFTNYVLGFDVPQSQTLTMRAPQNQKLYFATLVISGSELELGNIDVSGLDLQINGKSITKSSCQKILTSGLQVLVLATSYSRSFSKSIGTAGLAITTGTNTSTAASY